MGRNDKISTIDAVTEDLFEVRQTAIELAGKPEVDIDDVFFMKNLDEVETNIRKLNEYSDKCWLLSSILLYTLVYDKEMYTQSGLTWQEYIADSKKRISLSKVDISRQLSSARFFISHHNELKRAGWSPVGSARNLACAQLSLELSGDIDAVIQHLVRDTVQEFKDWYTSFKVLPVVDDVVDKRPDIVIEKTGIKVNGENAVIISDKLPESDRLQLEGYLEKIYSALKRGEVPAIVPVYDEVEARTLVRLRDKNRQGK